MTSWEADEGQRRCAKEASRAGDGSNRSSSRSGKDKKKAAASSAQRSSTGPGSSLSGTGTAGTTERKNTSLSTLRSCLALLCSRLRKEPDDYTVPTSHHNTAQDQLNAAHLNNFFARHHDGAAAAAAANEACRVSAAVAHSLLYQDQAWGAIAGSVRPVGTQAVRSPDLVAADRVTNRYLVLPFSLSMFAFN